MHFSLDDSVTRVATTCPLVQVVKSIFPLVSCRQYWTWLLSLSYIFSPWLWLSPPPGNVSYQREHGKKKGFFWSLALTLGTALTTRLENKWFYWASKKEERRHSTLHVQLKMSYEGTGSWCVEWWSSSLQSIQSCWKMKEWCLEPFPRIKTYTICNLNIYSRSAK